jgi:O-antigen/teichoic acid export membrane protein
LTAADPDLGAGEDNQLRGSGVMFAANVVTAAGALLSTLVVSRVLGAEGRGDYAFLVTVGAFVTIVSHLGLSEGLGYYAARHPEERRRLTRLYLGISALLTLPLSGGAWLLIHQLSPEVAGFDRVGRMALLGLIAVAGTAFDGSLVLALASRRFRGAARLSIASTFVPALITLGLAGAGALTVDRAILAWAGSRLLIAAAGWHAGLAGAPASPGAITHREVLSYSRRSFFAVLSGVFTARADQWLLGMLSGAAPLGVYAVAVSVSDPLQHVTSAAQRGYSPHIAVERDAPVALTERTVRGTLVALLCTLLVVAPAGWFLLPVVFGDEFAGSRTPFLVLLPGSIGLALLAIFSTGLRSTGSPGASSLVEILAATVMIAADLVLIPRYGATGAAAGATIGYCAGGVAGTLVFARRMGVRRLAIIPRSADIAAAAGVIRRLAARR